MRISEMQRRESFKAILIRTLTIGWSEQYGINIQLMPPETRRGKLWMINPILNAFYIPEACKAARLFLRDNFRFTPVPWRLPMQWILGTSITSPSLMKLTGRPAFRVSTSLPDEKEMLVVPGNQRIRIFNFNDNICRAFLKHGFDARTMLREIQVRGSGTEGPFLNIRARSIDGRWFEEPLLYGFALPRCPLSLSREKIERRAFELLTEWLDKSVSEVPVGVIIAAEELSIEAILSTFKGHFDGLEIDKIRRWMDVLQGLALSLGRITVAESHGDFQPGNIMIEQASQRVVIIDWEHCRQRSYMYDYLVYGLKTRFPKGLAKRLTRYLYGSSLSDSSWNIPLDPAWRRAALALFLIEDLEWQLAQSLTGPYLSLPESLLIYCQELEKFGPKLDDLFSYGSKVL